MRSMQQTIARMAKANDAMVDNSQFLEKTERLFHYPQADEPYTGDRSPCATLEIGGSSTHAKLYSLTRREASEINDLLRRMIDRRDTENRRIIAECLAELSR